VVASQHKSRRYCVASSGAPSMTSDAVFAIAVTLLVLEIRPPQDTRHLLPVLGMAVIAAFIPSYWLPIRGEVASAKPRRDRGGDQT
jgi:Endosomal/lysosomal potassium channel TMEM175